MDIRHRVLIAIALIGILVSLLMIENKVNDSNQEIHAASVVSINN